MPGMSIPDPALLERFRAALRFPTLWPADADAAQVGQAEKALRDFQEFLPANYPAFHRVARREVLSPFALVYRWPAPGPTAEKPVLFLAHYDVVPAETDQWTADPFGAEMRDGYIYGRGALDTKITLIAALEAAERLAAAGFAPSRDLWFAFGGDEERSGVLGARRIAAWLAEQGVSFAWSLDEGSIIAAGQLAGLPVPPALIGVEEKGFLDIELRVRQNPGHASMPPETQAAAVLGRALDRLARRPFPWTLTPTVENFFKRLAAQYRGPRAFVMAHARFFGPLFFPLAAGTPGTRALLRTTVAMTQLFGSSADNVLPSEVRAVLNLRLLAPWTVAAAVDYVRRAVADDRVQVLVSPERLANDPVGAAASASRGQGPGWQNLEAAVAAAFPGTPVLPFLVTATTDSRHYARLCQAVYRFAPLSLDPGELARIHGHDERVSLDALEKAVSFYHHLLAQL